jgi:hypothetical protein
MTRPATTKYSMNIYILYAHALLVANRSGTTQSKVKHNSLLLLTLPCMHTSVVRTQLAFSYSGISCHVWCEQLIIFRAPGEPDQGDHITEDEQYGINFF